MNEVSKLIILKYLEHPTDYINYLKIFPEIKLNVNCTYNYFRIDIDDYVICPNLVKKIYENVKSVFGNNDLVFQLNIIVKHRYLHDYDLLTMLDFIMNFQNILIILE